MPILILWIIWKIAEPQTTKMKRANNQGPTDAFSSGAFLEVLATLPRWVIFLLCFSLAIRIRCLATIFAAPPPAPATPSVSLARFFSGRCDRRSAPGGRAARARGLSGGALAPTTGPGRGGLRVWTLAGRGPTDDAGLSGRARRARGRCRTGRQNTLALPLWPPPGAWNVRGRKRTQRNNETVQQPVASNCFGIRCQRQHWTGPAPRKCRLRLLRKTEREGEVRRTDPSPAPPRTVKRGPKVARARVRGLFSVSLRPEVNLSRGSWPRKHKFAVSTPEETCWGRVRPSWTLTQVSEFLFPGQDGAVHATPDSPRIRRAVHGKWTTTFYRKHSVPKRIWEKLQSLYL